MQTSAKHIAAFRRGTHRDHRDCRSARHRSGGRNPLVRLGRADRPCAGAGTGRRTAVRISRAIRTRTMTSDQDRTRDRDRDMTDADMDRIRDRLRDGSCQDVAEATDEVLGRSASASPPMARGTEAARTGSSLACRRSNARGSGAAGTDGIAGALRIERGGARKEEGTGWDLRSKFDRPAAPARGSRDRPGLALGAAALLVWSVGPDLAGFGGAAWAETHEEGGHEGRRQCPRKGRRRLARGGRRGQRRRRPRRRSWRFGRQGARRRRVRRP